MVLDRMIKGVVAALPVIDSTSRGLEEKAYEDCLDAIICAWVGICAISGRAEPFGDLDSAIWIPRPNGESWNVPQK
jgi:predicted RNase H-like nuclease